MPGVLLSTTETVDCEQAASRATSVMVTRLPAPRMALRGAAPVRSRSRRSPAVLSIVELPRGLDRPVD